MATITEDYVSFEIAKLLKEKGFDAKCNKCYAYFTDDDIRFLNLKYSKSAQSLIEDRYPCVTLQMAMKWLREKDIHILFEITKIQKNPKYYCVIWNTSTVESYIIDLFDSYEQAAEAAIKYCLENLI